MDSEQMLFLVDDAVADLEALIHPTRGDETSGVQIEDLSPFLELFIDELRSLLPRFDISRIINTLTKICDTHIELSRPHGYDVPRITKAEREQLVWILADLKTIQTELRSDLVY